jgi:hypothetical protein
VHGHKPVRSGRNQRRQIGSRTKPIYAFPIVQNYLSIYQLALDPNGRQYKGPPNEVHNVARVFTPADTAIITPNSDTPYSYLIMDLRAEPIVVTLPKSTGIATTRCNWSISTPITLITLEPEKTGTEAVTF